MQMTPFVLLWHHKTARNRIKRALRRCSFLSWLAQLLMFHRERSLIGKMKLFPHPAFRISLGRGHCPVVSLEAAMRTRGCVWITAFPQKTFSMSSCQLHNVLFYTYILMFIIHIFIFYSILFLFIYSIFLKFKFAWKPAHGNQQRIRSPKVFSMMTL